LAWNQNNVSDWCYGVRIKTGWLGIKIMCPIGAME
jgi:hypothetical protein